MGPERNRHLLILAKDILSSLYYIYYKVMNRVGKNCLVLLHHLIIRSIILPLNVRLSL